MNKFALTITMALLTFSAFTVNDTNWIKYPKKYGLRTLEIGPKPGSPAPKDKSEETFKRIYSYPANLRLLVRATCGKQLSSKDLISRAQQLTESGSPVQEIDWDTIKSGEKFSYWAVVYSKSESVTFQLENQNDKWAIKSKSNDVKELWDVKKLTLATASNACIAPETFTKKALQTAMHDYLIEKSLANFRDQW